MQARTTHGQEPPTPGCQTAMAAADVFAPVSVSITHTPAVKEAAQAGARGLVLTQL